MRGTVILGMFVLGVPALAQSPAPTSPLVASSDSQLQLRYQIGVMERVLEQAVQHGAQLTSRQMSSFAPNFWLFTGPVRARGFRLEGYGLFFDVEVPALRRSLAWSFQTLDQQGLGIDRALESLRTHVASVSDQPARDALEDALERIELQVGPPTPPGVQSTAGAMVGGSPGETGGGQSPADPGDGYTRQVKVALIDAMLDHSGPIVLADDEWLTVAARDSQESLGPTDLYDVVTLVLRLSGDDLREFRAGRLTREEAASRVDSREF